MKGIIIILALLLPVGVMAQKKTISDLKELSLKGSVTLSDSAWSGTSALFFEPTKTNSWLWMTESKKAMEVATADKDGNIKVWIDRKRIVWTSDSTFTIKTK